jgi:ATP-binding cassette subfamily B protein
MATTSPAGPRKVGSLLLIWRFAARYKGHLAAAMLALLIAAAATLAIPSGFRLVIDRGFSGAGSADIGRYFRYMLGIVVVLATATALRFYFVSWLGERVVADVRAAVQRNLLTLAPRFFEENRPSEIASRLTADTSVIEQVVGTTVSVALRNLVMGIGGIVYLFTLAPRLTAMLLIGIPVIILPIVVLGGGCGCCRAPARTGWRRRHDRVGDARRDEDRPGVRPGAARGRPLRRGGGERVRYVAAAHPLRADDDRDRDRAGVRIDHADHVAGRARRCGGRLSGGTIAAFVITGGLVAGAFGSLTEVYGDLLRGAGAASRIAELLAECPRSARRRGRSRCPSRRRGGSRSRTSPSAIRRGARSRRWRLHAATWRRARWWRWSARRGRASRRSSSCASASTTRHRPGVDRRRGAARCGPERGARADRDGAAGDDHLCRLGPRQSALRPLGGGRCGAVAAAETATPPISCARCPEGLDTYLGEGGARLSGGQRQRVAIARAVLRDAPLLLLDEATSALDAESEQLVQRALERLMADRTTLVIAHRLATIRMADRIIVMDGGRIVEEGTHAALSGGGGLYARLARLQFDEAAA